MHPSRSLLRPILNPGRPMTERPPGRVAVSRSVPSGTTGSVPRRAAVSSLRNARVGLIHPRAGSSPTARSDLPSAMIRRRLHGAVGPLPVPLRVHSAAVSSDPGRGSPGDTIRDPDWPTPLAVPSPAAPGTMSSVSRDTGTETRCGPVRRTSLSASRAPEPVPKMPPAQSTWGFGSTESIAKEIYRD